LAQLTCQFQLLSFP